MIPAPTTSASRPFCSMMRYNAGRHLLQVQFDTGRNAGRDWEYNAVDPAYWDLLLGGGDTKWLLGACDTKWLLGAPNAYLR